MEYPNCPNCNAVIKTGVFNQNSIASKELTAGINYVLQKNTEAYCGKCQDKDVAEAREIYRKDYDRLK